MGATYDVEIANGYDYLFEEGLLKEGDTVGHIYFEGEYGANGLAGSQGRGRGDGPRGRRAADQVDRPGHERPDHPVQGGGRQPDRPHRAPGQLASVAGGGRGPGSRRPDPGQQPGLRPGLLQGPAANWLKSHLYVASPVSSFDANPELLKEYEEAYPDATPSLGVVVGFGMSEIMKQVLDAACENGDLTRAGVVEAFDGLEEVDTGGLVVPIRGFEPGKSPSLESFVLQPADVPGGATVVAEAFEGEFAEKIAG